MATGTVQTEDKLVGAVALAAAGDEAAFARIVQHALVHVHPSRGRPWMPSAPLPRRARASSLAMLTRLTDCFGRSRWSGRQKYEGTMLTRLLAVLAFLVALVAGCTGERATVSATPGVSAGSSPSAPSASESAAVSQPARLPEGTIVFLRTTGDDDHAYYIANADGTDERQLTEPGEYCCNNRISPDRSQILVMPGGEPPAPITGGLLSIDATEYTPLHLNDPTLNLVPQAWTPDGTRVAFDGWDDSDPSRTGIYTGGVPDVTDVVRVTSTGGAPQDIPLDYSPDGSRLVFYRAIRAEPDFPIDIGGSLWVINKDGSDARQLDTPPPNWWARWSPDGTTILFVSERNQPTGAISTIRSDGSGLTKVFEDPSGGFPIDPIWSPDGSQIMFMLDAIGDRFTHPNNVLYVMRSDGTGLTKLIDTPDFKSSPEWWSP